MTRRAGRHFLQIPGPTNVPDRVLRAIDFPTIDHRGPEFATLGKEVLAGMKRVFKTTQGEVVIYPASGTGAWEAALANTLSPGDRVLMVETGHFATLWQNMANRLGLAAEFIPGDWRRGADADAIGARLAEDREHHIKAVCVVHNETSTGVTSRIGRVREAIDRAAHPALRLGRDDRWVAEGDLLAFDRIANGQHVRCLFNLGGEPVDIATHTAGGTPFVALNGADATALPPCGVLWLNLKGTN